MKIAVVGATGLVGRKILSGLISRGFSSEEIDAFCSPHSAGTLIENIKTKVLDKNNLSAHYDYALFSAGAEISNLWAQKFVDLGAIVIDNSSAFRMQPETPLIVPEINGKVLCSAVKPIKNSNFCQQNKKNNRIFAENGHNCATLSSKLSNYTQNGKNSCEIIANSGKNPSPNRLSCNIISNPNCSTIQLALPLYFINKIAKIKRVIVSTYQSASGAGQKGLNDLKNGTSLAFPHTLKNDLIPQIDKACDDNFTAEEHKIMFELKKILGGKDLQVCATAVRVPIDFCHGESVNIELETPLDAEDARNALKNAEGIIVLDDLKNGVYPLASIATGQKEVFVGRIRNDPSVKNGLCFWVMADNTLKGAATNALQIFDFLTLQQ